MKVLVVSQYYYPEQFRITDICESLVQEGHEVTVLTGLPNYPTGNVPKEYKWFHRRYEQINGVTVVRASLIGRGKSSWKLALNYLSFAISASFRALFLKKDFDVVLVNQLSPVTMAIPAIIYKWIYRKKMMLYCLDLWPESIVSMGFKVDSVLYNLLLKLSRFLYRQADSVSVTSKLFDSYLINKIGVNCKKINYLPQYAEDIFSSVHTAVSEKSIIINLLFAGNIGEMQDVETIIRAANELKDEESVRWHIVGDGSARQRCEELALDYGLAKQVIFYGHKPLSEMPDFYNLVQAFLVTLKNNHEISLTLPGKVQSYMASGKPIIGSINGETARVIVDSNCGLVNQAEDYVGLAANIRQFINEKEKHILYGKNARRYYDNHFSKRSFMKTLTTQLQALSKG